MLFKSNKFLDLKSKKVLLKLVIQKLVLLKTCVIILWNIDHYQSIYVIFSILFSWQVNATTFWDLTTRKCVISMYTYIYVKLMYVAAQEVPFLEFHIPNLYIYIYIYIYMYTYIDMYICMYDVQPSVQNFRNGEIRKKWLPGGT